MTVRGLDLSELWREDLAVVGLPDSFNPSSVGSEDLNDARLLVSERELGEDTLRMLRRVLPANVGLESVQTGWATGRDQVRWGAGFGVIGEGAARQAQDEGLMVRQLRLPCRAGVAFAAAWSGANDNPALRRFLSGLRRAV